MTVHMSSTQQGRIAMAAKTFIDLGEFDRATDLMNYIKDNPAEPSTSDEAAAQQTTAKKVQSNDGAGQTPNEVPSEASANLTISK